MKQRAKRAGHEAKISVRETRRQRDTKIDDHPGMPGRPNGSRCGADNTVVLETTGEVQ